METYTLMKLCLKGYSAMNDNIMKAFTLSIAQGVRGVAANKTYSTQAKITCIDELKKAVQFDHVAGFFKNNERSIDNFISADCMMMDCDNDDSESPEKWLTPETLSQRLNDVEHVIVYSKSHMKDKSKYTARPRFHVYFPLSEAVCEADTIRAMKEKLLALVPEFDSGAKDSARFFYGVENPQGKYFEGSLCIDQFMAQHDVPSIEYEVTEIPHDVLMQSLDGSITLSDDDEIIPEGERNDTLFRFACKAIREYGEEEARKLFEAECARCEKSAKEYDDFDEKERASVWRNACKAVKKEALKKPQRKTKERKLLTLRVIEQTLSKLNITVRYNVITKELEVSDLPDNIHIHAGYYSLKGRAKKRENANLLPLFLLTYFKENDYSANELFITEALAEIANSNPLNPVRDMLNATTWDKTDRFYLLRNALGVYTYTKEGFFYCEFLKKWLIQSLALALNDEGDICADFVLVLQGKQGIGKTNIFRALAMRSEWFREGAVIDLRDKDSRMEATNTWITEIGELDATMKKEQANLKGFITAHFDTYRKPYARKADSVERRTVFCATVNPDKVIRDDTGSRRYAIIPVKRIDKDFIYKVMTPDWCAQLWRQIYEEEYLKNPSSFRLSLQDLDFIEKNNAQFTVMLEGESELRDSLAWFDEEKPDTPIEEYAHSDAWTWLTIKQLKERLSDIERLDPRKISRAITHILHNLGLNHEDFKDTKSGYTKYRLPPKKSFE